MLVTFVPLIGMVVLLYFFMIRPQKRKRSRPLICVIPSKWATVITTIGGIVGRVASIKEDTFVLETGSDRVKMRFKRWAIQDVEKLSLDTPADSSASK
jgi:preprotein translocase subunit YajC